MTKDDDTAALIARSPHELVATQNSDAWAWAEAFVRLNPNAGLDAATMVGWFSAYWSTVHDPLTNKNSDLTAALERATADAARMRSALEEALSEAQAAVERRSWNPVRASIFAMRAALEPRHD